MTKQWRELKETITEMRDNGGTGTQQDVCKFLANLMEILEKQMQESRWIPVSERLPKEDGKCLVTVDEKPFGMPSYTFVCECLYLNGWHLPLAKVVGKRRVVAWMPLPDPYTEVENAVND